MKNIFLNVQLLHSRYLLQTGRNSNIFTSVKCFSNFFSGSQTLRDLGPKSKNVRCLNSSVSTLNKSTQEVSSTGNNCNISIIYNGSLTHRVKGVKVFTCLTSIGGIALQPFMVQNIISGKDLPLGIALMSCVGFFTFVTPILCHVITKKYVTEIWYNSATDTYTATVLSFFLRKINIDFKISDVTIPDIPPLFSSICIKGKPILIMSDSFLDISHYKKMMGYDKEIDLNLNTFNKSYDKSEKKDGII